MPASLLTYTLMEYKKISVIIPVFNEKNTIADAIRLVEEVRTNLEKEIILVDDGSTDGSREILERYRPRHKTVFFDRNLGKGRAVRAGFEAATGDVVLIQDADLEYDPNQYTLLIQPIMEDKADVVYGSRFISNHPRRVLYYHHYLANSFLTFLSNLFTGLNLSDMETGYKVFKRSAVRTILPHLKSNRFGIEVELTAEIARHKLRVFEVGIAYSGRTYQEGKKIDWKDGLAAVFHIIRFNLFRSCR